MAITLIVGPSAGGKSEYAESAARKTQAPLVYIATMKPWDKECMARIEKHQRRRAADEYITFECPVHLNRITADALPTGCTILLECMSNLVANEMFDPDGRGSICKDLIVQEVLHLSTLCKNLIIVSNEVFCGGDDYETQTLEYLQTLAHINKSLAASADTAIEVINGMAFAYKGLLPI